MGSLLEVQADAALRAILVASGSDFEVRVTDNVLYVGTAEELENAPTPSELKL